MEELVSWDTKLAPEPLKSILFAFYPAVVTIFDHTDPEHRCC